LPPHEEAAWRSHWLVVPGLPLAYIGTSDFAPKTLDSILGDLSLTEKKDVYHLAEMRLSPGQVEALQIKDDHIVSDRSGKKIGALVHAVFAHDLRTEQSPVPSLATISIIIGLFWSESGWAVSAPVAGSARI
jgi:hypothetical protein